MKGKLLAGVLEHAAAERISLCPKDLGSCCRAKLHRHHMGRPHYATMHLCAQWWSQHQHIHGVTQRPGPGHHADIGHKLQQHHTARAAASWCKLSWARGGTCGDLRHRPCPHHPLPGCDAFGWHSS